VNVNGRRTPWRRTTYDLPGARVHNTRIIRYKRQQEDKFCKTHAKHGMVDVVSQRCGHPGCVKFSSFGVRGSTNREFCKTHAKGGMVCVTSR
ncbi:unnamed protein product, partial [Ectocarpus fasciculatus]